MQPITPVSPQRPRRSDRYRTMEENQGQATPQQAGQAVVSPDQPYERPNAPQQELQARQDSRPQQMQQAQQVPQPQQMRQAQQFSQPQQMQQAQQVSQPQRMPRAQQVPQPQQMPQFPNFSRPRQVPPAQRFGASPTSAPPAPRTPAVHMLQSAPPSQEAIRREERESYRLPVALTASIIVMALVCIGLFTGQKLMEAYLTRCQQERAAAYQRVVDAHPMQYRDIIDRYAAQYNLHPAFVCAIILNESSFNTSAESRVGARGLMQLMPDTAQWIAHKLDLDSTYAFDQLWEAETNIRFGCWYLNYLSKLFGGDAVTVASAYHAGQGEISSWLSNASYAPDGRALVLDAMPDGPTKTYAGRVTRDYAIYDALYDQVFNKPPHPDAAASASGS